MLDVLSSTPARPDSRSPCENKPSCVASGRLGHLRALASRIGEIFGLACAVRCARIRAAPSVSHTVPCARARPTMRDIRLDSSAALMNSLRNLGTDLGGRRLPFARTSPVRDQGCRYHGGHGPGIGAWANRDVDRRLSSRSIPANTRLSGVERVCDHRTHVRRACTVQRPVRRPRAAPSGTCEQRKSDRQGSAAGPHTPHRCPNVTAST